MNPPDDDSNLASSITAVLEVTLENQSDIETIKRNIIKAIKQAEKHHCRQNNKKRQKLTKNTIKMLSLRGELFKQNNNNFEGLRQLNKRNSKK